jgi:hypothetical protein
MESTRKSFRLRPENGAFHHILSLLCLHVKGGTSPATSTCSAALQLPDTERWCTRKLTIKSNSTLNRVHANTSEPSACKGLDNNVQTLLNCSTKSNHFYISLPLSPQASLSPVKIKQSLRGQRPSPNTSRTGLSHLGFPKNLYHSKKVAESGRCCITPKVTQQAAPRICCIIAPPAPQDPFPTGGKKTRMSLLGCTSLFLFLFFAVLGLELRALYLHGRCSTTWPIPLFTLVTFFLIGPPPRPVCTMILQSVFFL